MREHICEVQVLCDPVNGNSTNSTFSDSILEAKNMKIGTIKCFQVISNLPLSTFNIGETFEQVEGVISM